MDKWLKVSTTLAVLLAGTGAFCYFALVLPGIEQARLERKVEARRSDSWRLLQQRTALESCRQSVLIVFDVHWAAACITEPGQGPGEADGHPECDLPDAKAAVVNSWLTKEEARCLAEARTSP